MWQKRNEMLAPLTDLEGECGETKTTKKNKPKRKLGSGSQSIPQGQEILCGRTGPEGF
jgi:hypothetical protein